MRMIDDMIIRHETELPHLNDDPYMVFKVNVEDTLELIEQVAASQVADVWPEFNYDMECGWLSQPELFVTYVENTPATTFTKEVVELNWKTFFHREFDSMVVTGYSRREDGESWDHFCESRELDVEATYADGE